MARELKRESDGSLGGQLTKHIFSWFPTKLLTNQRARAFNEIPSSGYSDGHGREVARLARVFYRYLLPGSTFHGLLDCHQAVTFLISLIYVAIYGSKAYRTP